MSRALHDPLPEECPLVAPSCDPGHIAIVFRRYTVFRIACSRKWNRGNGLFLLVVWWIMVWWIMVWWIMV
jgi:hypothetical protein